VTQDATPAPDLTALQSRHFYRYPSRLVDAIVDYDRGRRLVAIKQVTVNEEFFQGHFPGLPLMPAVLQIESLTQAAAALVLEAIGQPSARVALRGINGGKFRRGVVPGDQLKLELTLLRARTRLAVVQASAFVAGDVVAEATLLLAIEPGPASIHPTAIVHAGARIGRGAVIGPYCVVGPHVSIGERCRLGASAVIDGHTTIGDETEIFPMASIGLAPQDLKYHGEPTRLTIGRRNIFREFVQINRGTEGGGGETRIGDGNLFMAYVHVAHDCHVGSNTIFGAHATLGGHVTVEDFANISAGSAVHQFCRVGPYAFIGGYSVVTKDAAPYARTIGARPARVFGVNSIGLSRRGFTPDSISQLKRAYRYLLQSKLNTSRALAAIERDASLSAPEVALLVDFIRTSKRGVILRRPTRRAEELVAEE
jgi:UDP-N-acetylglucosamine acyltransferase